MKKYSDSYRILRKIMKYIARYRLILIISLLLAAVSSLLSLYLPILTGDAIDLIVEPGQVDFHGLIRLLEWMAVVIGIVAICQWLMNVCNNRITYGVVKDLRHDTIHKLERLPLSYLDSHPTGDLVSRMITDADQFADGLLMGFSQLFTGLLTIFGTLLLMLLIHPLITAVVVLITPLSLFVAAFIAKKTYILFGEQAKIRGKQTTLIDEMIGNEKVLQAFSHEQEAMEEFDEVNTQLEKVSLRAIFFSSTTNPSTRFVNGLVYTGVALVGAFACINRTLTVGQLSCLLSYANQYTKPFNEISGVITELQNAIACAGRVLELIEETPQIPESENAIELTDASGNVNWSDVSFSYSPKNKLIENLSLQVTPGLRVAIVGPTGCGKTTLINLLMRFYDVNSGKICVDGNDIRDYTRHSLRTSFGMVLQETWLKPGTIRENIAMGKADATMEEIMEAAKEAHAHGFISRLENGYDTIIGEDGGILSQGQKQLICITRIMLSLPPMLILDEATSSIDTRTEIRIQKAFKRLMNGRTSFIVAHRLSTIREANIILVMKDGHIIEQGNHETLIEQNGFYANLYQSQFQ